MSRARVICTDCEWEWESAGTFEHRGESGWPPFKGWFFIAESPKCPECGYDDTYMWMEEIKEGA